LSHTTLRKFNEWLKLLSNVKNWIIAHNITSAKDIIDIFIKVKDWFLKKWTIAQPYVDKFYRWLIAAATTASTLKTSISFLPILVEILAILAAGIPLVGFLFPDFFLTEVVAYTILAGISIFVGLSKYNELRLRAELDATIEQNKEDLLSLTTQLKALETQLQNIHSKAQNISKNQSEPEAKLEQTAEIASNDSLNSSIPASPAKTQSARTLRTSK